MTDAHDNAHKDARELLAAIDAAELARAAYDADSAYPNGDALEIASEKLIGYEYIDADTLAAFTTLARAYRTLEAERDAAVARNVEQEVTLKWYADRKHYRQRFDPEIDDFTSDIDLDGGLLAYKALQATLAGAESEG